jgi:hypothetical protein
MRLTLAVAALSCLAAGPVHATLIWDGNASKGTGVFGLFGNDNCVGVGSSSLTAVSDPTHGTVWRYHKPSDSNRCESHGARLDDGTKYVFADGSTYYLGWWSKITSTVNNNANFQWKSYGTGHQQNFPYVLKMISGEMNLMYTAPGGANTFLWRRAITANAWSHFVLRINVSSSASTGSIDLWFNGVQQSFLTGGTRHFGRTFDTGGHNCPKWGVYGASGTDISNYVDELKVGTAFADMGAPGGGATPTPTPTPTSGPGPTATPTPTPRPGGGFSGYYRLTARHSGKAVVVQSASTADSANVFPWTYGGSATNDEWEIRSIGSGYFRVINRNSGKDMTVQSASTAEGANIFQFTYGGAATNDEWAIVDVGSGYHRITNRHSGKSAEVVGGGTGDGADVAQRTYSGATHQQFQLVSVP